MELLKESDYEDLTIGRICRNACLSRKSFYLYYHSKDDVLKEIYFNLLKYTYLSEIIKTTPKKTWFSLRL